MAREGGSGGVRHGKVLVGAAVARDFFPAVAQCSGGEGNSSSLAGATAVQRVERGRPAKLGRAGKVGRKANWAVVSLLGCGVCWAREASPASAERSGRGQAGSWSGVDVRLAARECLGGISICLEEFLEFEGGLK